MSFLIFLLHLLEQTFSLNQDMDMGLTFKGSFLKDSSLLDSLTSYFVVKCDDNCVQVIDTFIHNLYTHLKVNYTSFPIPREIFCSGFQFLSALHLFRSLSEALFISAFFGLTLHGFPSRIHYNASFFGVHCF